MSTYNPQLHTCYGCNEPFEDGQSMIGYFEHYIHTWCAPTYLLEQTIYRYTYKKEA